MSVPSEAEGNGKTSYNHHSENINPQELEHLLAARTREIAALEHAAHVSEAWGCLERHDLYRELNRQVTELLDMEMCALYLYHPDQEILIGQVPAEGMPDNVIRNHCIPMEKHSPVRQRLEKAKHLIIRDVESEPLIKQMNLGELINSTGIRSSLVVGLRHEHRLLGAIQASNKRNDASFSADDVRLLSIFANQAAITMRNAQLLEESQRHAERMASLYKMTSALAKAVDLDEMMNTVLAQVRRVVDYDTCLITLANASGDTIRIEATDGVSTQSLLGIELPADQGINAWIYREGVPLLIGDAGVDPRRLHIDKVSERMRAAIGAPLIADDQPIGTIYAARYEPHTFTEEDLDFLAITATQDERVEPFSMRLAEIQRLTACVIRSGQPLLIHNWEVEWRALPVEPLLVGDPTQSWLGVPMIVQDQVVGAIGAQSYQPHAFTARHMRLLSAIANQAGISLQNAKLLANFQLLSTDLQKVVNAQAHLLRTIEEMIPDLGLQGENQASPRLPEEATHG